MKKMFILVATAATVLVSCKKEEVAVNNSNASSKELVQLTFTASSAPTKTLLNPDRSVSFKPGETIAVFAEGDSAPYLFTTTDGGLSATFTGTAPVASKYYAAFPYSATLKLNGGTIEGLFLNTSSDGTGTGTYNSKKAVSVAVSTDQNFYFRQLTALLKITVPAEVTDLKEVIIFNRDQAASNLAGAISGTFNATPSADSDPTITVTTPTFQAGFTGPGGSSVAVPAGTYYVPVLPATLTYKKGLDLKISFLDGFVGRAFNGNSLTMEAGKVYNLGIIAKTAEFVDNGFEQQDTTGYAGNTDALKVVENPYKTAINPSDYVLKNDMSGSTFSSSGFVSINTTRDYAYTKFPSSVRGFYDRIRIKVYLGTNKYYPRMLKNGGAPVLPSKLNGVAVTSQDVWDATVLTDDWNVLEFTASDLYGVQTLSALQIIQIKFFLNYDGSNNIDDIGPASTTNNRLVYLDDITYVLK